MLLLPSPPSVSVNHILFSARLGLISELFSTEIHVIIDNQLALASELKHVISVLKSSKSPE